MPFRSHSHPTMAILPQYLDVTSWGWGWGLGLSGNSSPTTPFRSHSHPAMATSQPTTDTGQKGRSKNWEAAKALMDNVSWMSLREVTGPYMARATEPLHPFPSVQRKELSAAERNRQFSIPNT